ncbi:MAG: hypothetical protein R3348_07125 [Xanthomonadales bacterium]|nr:hypothetical protein [Xanthomonadales bacterium]
MKSSTRLMLLGLLLVNGMTVTHADVVVDGQVIEGADISDISIDPVSGNVNITAGGLYTVTKDGEPPAGPSVVINSLTASDTSILEGESVSISWVTTDADSCAPSSGGGGWSSASTPVPSGTAGPFTLPTAGTYTFRLTCQNDTPSSTFRTVSVNVSADTPPPVPSSCPDPALSGAVTSWFSMFDAVWPSPRYREVIATLPRRGYLAIEFDTGSAVGDGGVSTITHTSTNGLRFGAISECPGDFSEHLPLHPNTGEVDVTACTESWYIGGSIKWSIGQGYTFGHCHLDPDKTYYVNLTFTDGVDPLSDDCESSTTCRTYVRVWE